MGQLNPTRILNALKGLYSALDASDELLLQWVTDARRKEKTSVTDGGTAATAQTATPVWTNDTGANVLVTALALTTPVAVTANASNNLTCTVDRVDAAGANATTIGVYTSDVAGGSTVAHVPKALTLTAANVVVPAGGTIRVAVSKGGTGVAFAAATSQAYINVTYVPQT
jgi:hypothetical protein